MGGVAKWHSDKGAEWKSCFAMVLRGCWWRWSGWMRCVFLLAGLCVCGLVWVSCCLAEVAGVKEVAAGLPHEDPMRGAIRGDWIAQDAKGLEGVTFRALVEAVLGAEAADADTLCRRRDGLIAEKASPTGRRGGSCISRPADIGGGNGWGRIWIGCGRSSSPSITTSAGSTTRIPRTSPIRRTTTTIRFRTVGNSVFWRWKAFSEPFGRFSTSRTG